ncbi:MAG: histidine kinase [Firmicutes bacterium]|nr:histidine kinase [Bacillota bacterium]
MEELIQSGVPHIIIVVVILIGLTFTVLNDPYIQKKQRRIMLLLIAVCAVLIVQNYTESVLSFQPPDPSLVLLRTVESVLGYSLRPVVIVLFFYITDPARRYTPAWILILINAAVYLTTFFSRICFQIDEGNHWQPGPLHHFAYFVSIVLLAYYLYLTCRTYRGIGRREMFLPAMNVLLIVLAVQLDYADGNDRPISFLSIAIVITSLFAYIWLHLRFAEEHVSNLETQQRLNIMKSQMQPHFLFNTLATIQVLCNTDPKEASRITGRFGKYLRQNLDSLEQDERIDFDKELEHTMNYAAIEMVRFPNIRIETDIRDRDFTLPALTVQPMVENAIRHGVRIRSEGIIRISTGRSGGYHEIVIADNGEGFDLQRLDGQEGLHLGIRNVRERIEKMCGGSLQIQSAPDDGTTVVIRIPEEKRP